MSEPQDPNLLVTIGVPVVSFVLGFTTSRFTMTKKERKDFNLKLQETSNALLRSLHDQFQIFTEALAEYSSKQGPPSLVEFANIATTGEGYFLQLKMICDSLLSGNIDRRAFNNTHRRTVKEAVERSLPEYYGTLQEIAGVCGIEYLGILNRENYKSIFEVYDKYCHQ